MAIKVPPTLPSGAVITPSGTVWAPGTGDTGLTPTQYAAQAPAPTPTPVTSKSIPVIPAPTPVPFVAPPVDAEALKKATVITEYKLGPPVIPTPKPKSTPTPAPTTKQTEQQILERFQTSPGQYDLIAMMKAAINDSQIKDAAKRHFALGDIQYAEYAAKPEFDISTDRGSKAWKKLTEEQKQHLRPVRNVDIVEYAQMSDWEKLGVKGIKGKKVSQAAYAQLGPAVKERGLASPEPRGWQEKVRSGSMIAAEVIVPGLYAVRHWDRMGAGEKALILTIDVFCVLPFTGAAVRGARAATVPTRTARLTGAFKGVSHEALAQVRWPIDLIVHPIETTKGMVKGLRYSERNVASLIENVVHPRKIPEAVITTADGTVRLPVKYTTSKKQAMEFRSKIMKLAQEGKRPIVQIGDLQVEVARSPLMKEAGGGLAHATPMGEAFSKGTKVEIKSGKATSEQGLFFSHEPLPRFVEVSAFGKTGEKPVFMIISKETAEKAVETGKVYRGTVEMERKLPVGARVYAPKQRLYTRVGATQDIVEIWLEKPLSMRQVVKLKASGLVETIRAPFTPAIKIKKFRGSLTLEEVDELAKIIGRSDSELATRLRRTARIINRGRYAPSATRTLARLGIRPEGVRGRVSAREARLSRQARAARERATAERQPARAERLAREDRMPRETREARVERVPRETRVPRDERVPREGRTTRVERIPRDDEGGKGRWRRRGDMELKIERVEGMPENPGIITYNDGIVKVIMKPPYRQGTDDIDFERLEKPQRGKGSQEDTLRVQKGKKAPKRLELSRGVTRTAILGGKKMQHSRQYPQRGPGIVLPSGRVIRQKRGSVLV